MTMPHPHQTCAPSRRFWDMYDPDRLTLPSNADDPMEDRHPLARQARAAFRDTAGWCLYEPSDWDSVRRRVLNGYYGCVSQVDDAVGRVLATGHDASCGTVMRNYL